MKFRPIILFVIALVFLGQVVPGGRQVFAVSNFVESGPQAAYAAGNSTVLVKVVPLPAQSQVVVPVRKSGATADCSASNLGQDIALQNTLNSLVLKLPADCFSLIPGQAVSASSLNIVTDPIPQTNYTIVVLPHAVQYLNEMHEAAPLPAREVPIVPLAFMGFVAMAGVNLKRLKFGGINKTTLNLRQALSINQLQMYKC